MLVRTKAGEDSLTVLPPRISAGPRQNQRAEAHQE